MKTITLTPIMETGGSRTGTLTTSYDNIIKKIFEPNVTHMDDPDKVRASWGFSDDAGRKSFIWCYKYYGKVENCDYWSVDGDKDLLKEIFGDDVSLDKF